jgi:hypothetical protein
MEATLDGTTRALRAEQRLNTAKPILVKLEGRSKVTEDSFEQPKNAVSPRETTPVGTVNAVRAVQP